MSQTPTRRMLRSSAIGLLLIATGFIGILADRATPSAAPSPTEAAVPQPPPPAISIRELPRREPSRAVSEADGALPDGVTVFDDEYPGVANLDPDLLRALRQAATDAADAGIEITINSGWRSAAYQNELLREAITRYGSEEEAARWVATAETSPHVSGDAIDIGSDEAMAWLNDHGAEYGLCQIYRNEPWHFELRPEAIDGRCPQMYADPAEEAMAPKIELPINR